jgi:hypothetical protein
MPYYSADSPDVYLTRHDTVLKGERSLRYYCAVWWSEHDPRNYSEWLEHWDGAQFRGATVSLQEAEYVYIEDLKIYIPITRAQDYPGVDWYRDRHWWNRNQPGHSVDSKGLGHYAKHYADYVQLDTESHWAELRDAVNTDRK